MTYPLVDWLLVPYHSPRLAQLRHALEEDSVPLFSEWKHANVPLSIHPFDVVTAEMSSILHHCVANNACRIIKAYAQPYHVLYPDATKMNALALASQLRHFQLVGVLHDQVLRNTVPRHSRRGVRLPLLTTVLRSHEFPMYCVLCRLQEFVNSGHPVLRHSPLNPEASFAIRNTITQVFEALFPKDTTEATTGPRVLMENVRKAVYAFSNMAPPEGPLEVGSEGHENCLLADAVAQRVYHSYLAMHGACTRLRHLAHRLSDLADIALGVEQRLNDQRAELYVATARAEQVVPLKLLPKDDQSTNTHHLPTQLGFTDTQASPTAAFLLRHPSPFQPLFFPQGVGSLAFDNDALAMIAAAPLEG